MKRLILTVLLLGGLVGSASAQMIASTNLSTSANTNTFLLLASRASVYNVQLSVPTASGVVTTFKLYDQNTLAAPEYGTNYVTAANVGRGSYTTNVASSYIGFNGVTNWYTNSYLWTYNITNAAATNALNPTAVYYVPPGEAVLFDANLFHTRGIVVYASTNATIAVTYRP